MVHCGIFVGKGGGGAGGIGGEAPPLFRAEMRCKYNVQLSKC